MGHVVISPLLRLGFLVTVHGRRHPDGSRRTGWHADLRRVSGSAAWHACLNTPLFHAIATGPV